MSRESNEEYYARRAADEKRMAEEATDPKLAALHHEMATRYEELAGPKPEALQLRAG